MKLSDNKLQKLKSLQEQGGFWYITKQNLVFRDLCFMAKILESWNDDQTQSYEVFFNAHKTMPEYGSFDALVAHRATKNCEYLGLLYTPDNGKYSATNLTPFYYALKQLCNGDFNHLSHYPKLVDKQLERMFVDSSSNVIYNVTFKINPFMFLFKILLLIGDITKRYQISIQEFKLFVATSQSWNDYFEVVESILRYRSDMEYQKQCDANKSKVADVRMNILAQNHSQLEIGGSDIAIKDGFVKEIRKKVAEYELNDKIETTDDVNNADIVSSLSLQQLSSDHRLYIAALKTKPFLLLAGISGTGKSRIVRELARACWDAGSEEYKAHKPSNFEMVQVKPNWHDSSELIGYVSRVSGDPVYVAGPFLKFVAKAWENPDVPYFLCLDEMNLAPVEQYFAEYLSVVESRKAEDGVIKTDPILPKSKEDWYRILTAELTLDDMLRERFLEEGICIPQNLIVVGTVNMDETTFSFSRKVLDRAMTIEMNEVDLTSGLDKKYEGIGKLDKTNLIGTAVEGCDVYNTYKSDCDTAIAYLNAVNQHLEKTPFKVAYRTRNEYLLYVVNNLPYNKDQDGKDVQHGWLLARALDEITCMKVLSRIEGDETKVSKEFLSELTKEIRTQLEKLGGCTYTAIRAEENKENNVWYSKSLDKLDEMTKRLESGYTSFWS